MPRVVRSACLAAALLAGAPAHALFHVAVIDEVATSVGGDRTQQYVEIRMLLGGQNRVRGSVLAAFDADGEWLGDLLVVPDDVPAQGPGVRWLMATRAFADAHPGLAVDFVFESGFLPVQNGMVCWGAPGVQAPDPEAWDHTDPRRYVDCVAYGAFCGNSPGGPPVAATPADHALARVGTTSFTNQDFACTSTLTPENNAGQRLVLAAPECGAPVTAACGPTVRGGRRRRARDCFVEWVVPAAKRPRPRIVCRDGDPACDVGGARGCLVRAALCLADAENALYGGRCTEPDVSEVAFASRPGSETNDINASNRTVVTGALAALGAGVDGDRLVFDPPVKTKTCTVPFVLSVPLGPDGKRGMRRFRTRARSGRKIDRDTLTVVCRP